LPLVEVLGCFEQRPARVLKPPGRGLVAGAAQLVPVVTADLVERPVAQGDHVIRVDRDDRVGGVLAGALGIARAHVERDHFDRVRAGLPEILEEPVGRRLAVAFGAPHDLTANVIGDEGEVAVLLAPGHLVDPDLEQIVQPIRIELVGADARDDPPDGVPVDPDQPLDRRLVGPGGQPRDERLEVAREPTRVPGERNALHPDPVLGALKPPQLSAELEPPHAEIEVPPDRLDMLAVMTVRRGELAQRAPQPPTSERDPHHHPVGVELHLAHPDPVQAQQARESRVDAHRRPPVELLDLRQPAACRARTAGASLFKRRTARSDSGSRYRTTYIDAGSPINEGAG
jgi:hypothetical protein